MVVDKEQGQTPRYYNISYSEYHTEFSLQTTWGEIISYFSVFCYEAKEVYLDKNENTLE